MSYYVINGGRRLSGTVDISGAKNAAVAIIPAVILCEEECTLRNIPDIEDVHVLSDILREVGAKVDYDRYTKVMKIDSSTVYSNTNLSKSMRKMRASYYMLGALLGRFGEAHVACPGGCVIGDRPMDLHIQGLHNLGVNAYLDEESETIEATGRAKGHSMTMRFKSVGATINIMLAAVKADGSTIINNAAKEPHIVDVANFLNAMGADVMGAGTETIMINGRSKLHGCDYEIIPDQIEAGTFMIAAAATRSVVTVRNVIPKHLERLVSKLVKCGVIVEEGTIDGVDCVRVSANKNHLVMTDITTEPYPGFPTDLQQPMTTLLSTVSGCSTINENIYERRFEHIPELMKMGADIKILSNHEAEVRGVESLHGAEVSANDLRAGAALVIAGLCATGTTIIRGVKYIDRGYEDLDKKLIRLGASIRRFDD